MCRTVPSSKTTSNSKLRNSRPNRAAAWMGRSSAPISTPSFIGRKFMGRSSGGAVTETFVPRGRRSSSAPKRFASISVPWGSRAIHTAAGTASRMACNSAALRRRALSCSFRSASRAAWRLAMAFRRRWRKNNPRLDATATTANTVTRSRTSFRHGANRASVSRVNEATRKPSDVPFDGRMVWKTIRAFLRVVWRAPVHEVLLAPLRMCLWNRASGFSARFMPTAPGISGTR